MDSRPLINNEHLTHNASSFAPITHAMSKEANRDAAKKGDFGAEDAPTSAPRFEVSEKTGVRTPSVPAAAFDYSSQLVLPQTASGSCARDSNVNQQMNNENNFYNTESFFDPSYSNFVFFSSPFSNM